MTHQNLLGETPATLLPDEAGPRELLAGGSPAAEVAAAHPTSCLAWAILAETALGEGRTIEGYAYARTGYHRGLDSLRRNGWKGQGPVPWEHEPNRGFLRALAALGAAADQINETTEAERVRTFLADCSPTAVRELGGPAGE